MNTINSIFHRFGYWKSKIRVPAWLGSGENSSSGLQTANILLYPPVVETGVSKLSGLLHKGPDAIHAGFPS